MSDILLGPILGYEWDATTEKSYYTVIARISSGSGKPNWVVGGKTVPMKDLSGPLHDGSSIWRGEIQLNPFTAEIGETISYNLNRAGANLTNACGDKRWRFFLPGRASATQQPRIAFCSCNGFSDPKAAEKLDPLALWKHFEALHNSTTADTQPYSLLLMGGDQLYCDNIARQEDTGFSLWTWLEPGSRKKAVPSPAEFLQRYVDHYIRSWVGTTDHPHKAMIRMMASVPSIMVWDDHDIYDGWGSYKADPADRPYYVQAFDAARQTFEWYQARGKTNRSLIDRNNATAPRHFSQGLRFGPYDILTLDNRTHRTPTQIMDGNEWDQITAWAQNHADAHQTLLVVAPIPVVYRRFADWITELPGEHGGEDDLRDHWNHKDHEGERNRLIHHLFNWRQTYHRVTLVSGDVHIGSLGFLDNTETKTEIAQIVSSGIVHPAPSALEWAGVSVVSSDEDYTIRAQPVIARLTRPQGTSDRFMRCRNFVWFREGNDGKLWINWECEDAKAETGVKQVATPIR